MERNESSLREEKEDLERENSRREMPFKVLVGSLVPNLPIHASHSRDSGVCGMAVTNPPGKSLFCMEIALPGTISSQEFTSQAVDE